MRLNGVQEVAGSNPAGPICQNRRRVRGHVLYLCLRSTKTERRYVGSCKNVEERFDRHNAGHSKATRHGVPWVLEHTESFPTRADATRRERYLKTGRGRDELDELRR